MLEFKETGRTRESLLLLTLPLLQVLVLALLSKKSKKTKSRSQSRKKTTIWVSVSSTKQSNTKVGKRLQHRTDVKERSMSFDWNL